MIFYRTDNSVSIAVSRAFESAGIESRHINDFQNCHENPIFYGILRGTGAAIRICQYAKMPFTYLDNGYFDAVYRDSKGVKNMSGEYRLCQNELITKYTGGAEVNKPRPMSFLLLPPTPYTAFMHDTIPEDWINTTARTLTSLGHKFAIREKESTQPFADQIKNFDAVYAFNSMGVVEAVKQGKAAYTTHGILNDDLSVVRYYNYDDLINFYSTKQFTLAEIAEGKWQNH